MSEIKSAEEAPSSPITESVKLEECSSNCLPSSSVTTSETAVVCSVEGEGPSNFLQRAVSLDNKVFVYGGENSKGFWTNSLTILEGETKKCITWKKPRCFDFPPKTDSHSVAVFENSLIIFGGNDNQWINGGNNSIYCLDLEKLEWSVLPENESQDTNHVPQGRKQHTTTVVGDRMYIFGGISSQVGSDNVFNDLYAYDLRNRVWNKININGDSPSPRSGHSMVYNPQSESLIVMGGKVGGSYTNEVWSLSLSSLNWTLMNTTGYIPSGRENHTAVVCTLGMVIYGGWNVGGPNSDLYSLDMTTFEWKKYTHNGEADPNSKRFGHACVYIDGSVLILGGKNHLFNNQPNIIKLKLEKLTEEPVQLEETKEKKEMEEIVVDIDEKMLSDELFTKPNFDPKDVVLYKNIFDQLTDENIKQYEELNTLLMKQKLFSSQVECLIESNKTLMAKEFIGSSPSNPETIIPTICTESVETPESYKELIGQVFQQTQTSQHVEDNHAEEEKLVVEEERPPKLPETVIIVEDQVQESNDPTPVIPISPRIIEGVNPQEDISSNTEETESEKMKGDKESSDQ